MFSKWFGRKEKPPAPSFARPDPGPQIGMLCLRSGTVDPAAVVEAWAELFPDIAPLTHGSPEEGEDGPEIISFETGSDAAMMAFLPMPVPGEDIPEAIRGSWMIQDDSIDGAHQSHAIVVPMGSKDPVAGASLATRLLAAALRCSDSAGVYWGNGGQFHTPEVFTDLATELLDDGSLPTMLWIGVRHSAPGPRGPWTVTTIGMRPFGHLEFEIIDSTKRLGDLRMTVLELAGYVLEQGPVLKHGDTFGATPEDRTRVEHTTSKFRDNEPVIRLHM